MFGVPTFAAQTELDIGCIWGENDRLGTLKASMPAEIADPYGYINPGNARDQFEFGYGYGDAALAPGAAVDRSLLTSLSRSGRINATTLKNYSQTKYRYETGRNGLVDVENHLKNGSSWNQPNNPAFDLEANRSSYTLNQLGQRTAHRMQFSMESGAGNGIYQQLDSTRTWAYNARGEAGAAKVTSAITTASTDMWTLGQEQYEHEQYAYDAIGNRNWASRGPVPAVDGNGKGCNERRPLLRKALAFSAFRPTSRHVHRPHLHRSRPAVRHLPHHFAHHLAKL